jgi:hypothetical protein
MRPSYGIGGLALSLLLAATGCGGSNRVLESITVNGVTSANGTTFTATGHYSSAPETVTGIPVAWFQTGVAVDPPGPNWDFTLAPKPTTGQCYTSDAAYTYWVIAYAPTNPEAPAAESMPFTVFETLVEQHSTPSQDGFVAGSAQLNCPGVTGT